MILHNNNAKSYASGKSIANDQRSSSAIDGSVKRCQWSEQGNGTKAGSYHRPLSGSYKATAWLHALTFVSQARRQT